MNAVTAMLWPVLLCAMSAAMFAGTVVEKAMFMGTKQLESSPLQKTTDMLKDASMENAEPSSVGVDYHDPITHPPTPETPFSSVDVSYHDPISSRPTPETLPLGVSVDYSEPITHPRSPGTPFAHSRILPPMQWWPPPPRHN